MTPNKEHIQLWVEALRSGKYEQGRDCLRFEDTFCCLGVACDISGLGEWRPNGAYLTAGHRSKLELPPEVVEWLGVGRYLPELLAEDGTKDTADRLNDVHNYTFEQIAEAIERTFLKGDDDAPSGD